MNSFLAVVCLISGLVTPGYAILCTNCSTGHTNLTNCTGNTVTCISNLVCVTLYRFSNIGSDGEHYFARGCGDKSICGKSGALGFPEAKKYRFSATCCQSDYCTPPTPVLPPLKFNENGKTCPFCLYRYGIDCVHSENMTCTGDENMCALYNLTERAGSAIDSSVLSACATEGFCDQGSWKMEAGGIEMEISTKCGASAALYSALTLLILATASLISNVF
ncbi:phospholipase A2 inhibitor and Ly6/PLAUR domain-containing protein-like [Aquarana catesbeiana]|uniref:phospholipase A2 inhibitor and Ly6/PLAUR domain-containing protein-like n=1 Tax=Aquarana catesbeiana TaxID=8400 RepID=UPI003CC952A3